MAEVTDDGRRATSENPEAQRREHVDELVHMQTDLVQAAEAAATAAARAVDAVKAVETAAHAREAQRDDAATAAADATRMAANTAKVAAAEAAQIAETSDEAVVLESPAAQDQDLDKVGAALATEPHDGGEALGQAAAADSDEGSDLLGLDSPGAATPRVLARLGLLALLGAAGCFALSFLLVSMSAKGTVLDVVVLVAWLGVVALSVVGVLLVAAAGVAKVAGVQTRSSTSTD